MSDTPSLALPLIAAGQAQKHVTHNTALAVLDAVVQLSVRDRSLTSPPGSPAEGDRYIVAAGATGAWTGREGEIAARQGGTWTFYTPAQGWRSWVEDEDALLIFDGAAWVDAGAAIKVLQNLTLLGIGTTADATNPFAAKLNKALWSAKTAAEGGDGDLRYTMNKENAADVVSLLLQTGFSGRAELGLIGDDDFVVKMSPDGSAWIEALRLDKDDGNIGLGVAPTEALHVRRTGATAVRINVEGESGVNNQVHRASADASGPFFVMRKSRGTIAAPANPNQNDALGSIAWQATPDGTTFWTAAQAFVTAIAATPSATARDGRLVVQLGAAAATPEVLRLENATGLSMFGANVVIDQNRHHRLRSYTIGTLPSASPAGQMIHCSDLGGGGGQLNSDGTSWRRVSRGGQQAVATDAAFTLTALTSAEEQKHTGTLTANRAVTLSTTNAYAGARFHITRTGGGAFTLDVGTGPLKSLATNTWGEFIHDGAAWYLAAYGAL